MEKIIVHAPEKIDGERHMQVDIHLKFIGNFQVAQQKPTAEEAAAEEQQRKRRALNRGTGSTAQGEDTGTDKRSTEGRR